jgi:uncharacterized protein
MEDLVEAMARYLVDEPEQVRIDSFDEEGDIIIELRVAADDIGKVIGRQGRTARSMRVILEAASEKLGEHYELDIVEDDDAADDDFEDAADEGTDDASTQG